MTELQPMHGGTHRATLHNRCCRGNPTASGTAHSQTLTVFVPGSTGSRGWNIFRVQQRMRGGNNQVQQVVNGGVLGMKAGARGGGSKHTEKRTRGMGKMQNHLNCKDMDTVCLTVDIQIQ
jgi:hypothetical protein